MMGRRAVVSGALVAGLAMVTASPAAAQPPLASGSLGGETAEGTGVSVQVVAHADGTGQLNFRNSFGGRISGPIDCVAIGVDGTVAVAGTARNANQPGWDNFIAWFDADGEWFRLSPGTLDDCETSSYTLNGVPELQRWAVDRGNLSVRS